jgi:hypothetical protein
MRRPAAASIASRDKASKDAGSGAILQPLLGGHADWGAGLQKSFRKLRSSVRGLQKAFNRLQSPSENFSPFLGIEDYQWLTGDGGQKKLPTAPVGRTGSRAAEANRP